MINKHQTNISRQNKNEKITSNVKRIHFVSADFQATTIYLNKCVTVKWVYEHVCSFTASMGVFKLYDTRI
jgi:hypothetical protein